MTIEEQRKIDASNAAQGRVAGFKKCMANGGAAFGVGFLVEGGKTLLDKGLAAVKKKDKFDAETVKEIVKDGVIGGSCAGITAVGVTAFCVACPPVGVALTALSPYFAVIGTGKVVYDFGSILNKHFGYRRAQLHAEDNILYLFESFVPAALNLEELIIEDYRLELKC